MFCFRRVLTILLLHYTAAVRGEEEVVVKHVTVPDFVGRGEQVELGCHWQLPQDKLYSLKWYLDDREFFRYMPEEEPSIEVHPLPGVNVNREASTAERVVLNNVQLTSSGKYKCEVIAEAPNFHTADKSANMTVVHIPNEEPRIYGRQHKYHIGDTTRLTCVSASSSPRAELTWFINDKQAPQEYIIDMTDSQSEQGLVETRKGLQFVVSHEHFHKGELKLRCSAKISTLYYKTQQHSVDVHLSYSVPVMESRDILALSGSSSSSCSSSRVGQQQQQVVMLLLLMTLVLEMTMLEALELTSS
ncbi:cell adhesion molecule 2-like isoform X2 [Procambarus clarkii]|uniref:cell adhesion molecule 2-like isoform X2 n=1 Tax=Procambarus clarkii TaxID=6728 RepID=UPI003742FA20